ncbi:L,D-transpeptidase [Mesorhizobium sp. M1396]|uniref:L,D-transpeptidase n=1 Tax=Mesorhizobium sp. M1396 TaxID=2957095 RepID=UPI0033370BB4
MLLPRWLPPWRRRPQSNSAYDPRSWTYDQARNVLVSPSAADQTSDEGMLPGARALYIGNTLYRVHGTNQPRTVGQANSSGCIRMTNEDVIDLYDRVKIGAQIIVRH